MSDLAALAPSVKAGIPMLRVPDVARTLEWFTALGFRELNRFDDDGEVNFGMLALGNAMFMLALSPCAIEPDTSLWFYTDRVDEMWQVVTARDLEVVEPLYNPFYGGRQFSVKDVNGYVLVFYDPDHKAG